MMSASVIYSAFMRNEALKFQSIAQRFADSDSDLQIKVEFVNTVAGDIVQ